MEGRKQTFPQHLSSHPPELRPLEEMVGGKVYETPTGCCLVVEESFPLSYRHGSSLLAEAFECSGGRLLAQGGDGRLEGFGPERALFVDTETTGLAMGTGTYAFIAGVGALRGGRFLVRQLFMRDLCEEAAFLYALRDILKEGEFLVSFNGKCYDIPLLENRFIMCRTENDVSTVPHLDLLYTVRRLWKHRLVDCRLATVERELLGVRRIDDIPAQYIPRTYFDYLKGRGYGEIKRVFHHNLLDILSLAVLSGVINGMVAGPHGRETEDGGELLALGGLWEEAGITEEGRFCYERALGANIPPEQRRRAMARLSLIHKREGCWEEALCLWEQMSAEGTEDIFPYIELAKYYEHRAGDFGKALELVNEALGKIYFSDGLWKEGSAGIVSGLEYRRNRLERRSGTRGGP